MIFYNLLHSFKQFESYFYLQNNNPEMEQIIELHNYFVFYGFVLLIILGWILLSIVYYISINMVYYKKYLNFTVLIKLIWAIILTSLFILLCIISLSNALAVPEDSNLPIDLTGDSPENIPIDLTGDSPGGSAGDDDDDDEDTLLGEEEIRRLSEAEQIGAWHKLRTEYVALYESYHREGNKEYEDHYASKIDSVDTEITALKNKGYEDPADYPNSPTASTSNENDSEETK